MNKVYDKLILLVGVVVLLVGVGVYYLKAGDRPSDPGRIDTSPAANAYNPVPVPETPETEANWPEPQAQSSGWRYDVFTPPKIFLDPEGGFSAEGYEPPPPPEPFGVYLADLSRDRYRIQLEGYVREQGGDTPQYLALFFDEERSASVRARVGDTVDASEFELLDFEVERNVDPAGGIERVAVARIEDKRTGKTLELTGDSVRFESGVTVQIRSRQDTDVAIELTETGERFSTPSGAYILQEINLDAGSVTVEKQPSESQEGETKRLFIDNGDNTPDPTDSPDRATDSEAERNPSPGDEATEASDADNPQFMF